MERAPSLAPGIGTAERVRFYRLLVWLVANVYPTFTYGDHPERRVPSAPHELDDATARHRERLHLWLERQVAEPFVLGDTVCALDAYVAVLVMWRPRPDRFRRSAPRLAGIAERTRRLPPIAAVMRRNGWQPGPGRLRERHGRS